MPNAATTVVRMPARTDNTRGMTDMVAMRGGLSAKLSREPTQLSWVVMAEWSVKINGDPQMRW